MKSLVTGGITIRIACGTMTLRASVRGHAQRGRLPFDRWNRLVQARWQISAS